MHTFANRRYAFKEKLLPKRGLSSWPCQDARAIGVTFRALDLSHCCCYSPLQGPIKSAPTQIPPLAI